MFTSPKEFALDNETGHAEYSRGFCGVTDRVVFNATRISKITVETSSVSMDLRYYGSNCLGVFNVKLASPETFKDPIVKSAKLTFALTFSPQQTDCGER